MTMAGWLWVTNDDDDRQERAGSEIVGGFIYDYLINHTFNELNSHSPPLHNSIETVLATSAGLPSG